MNLALREEALLAVRQRALRGSEDSPELRAALVWAKETGATLVDIQRVMDPLPFNEIQYDLIGVTPQSLALINKAAESLLKDIES